MPRLVEQVRALLWFQYYMTLVALLSVVLFVGLFSSGPVGREMQDWAITAMFQLAILAAALFTASKLWQRGWVWVYVMVVIAELGAVAVCVYVFLSWRDAPSTGITADIGALVYAGLTLWVLIDLFRGETLRYVFGRTPRPYVTLRPPP